MNSKPDCDLQVRKAFYHLMNVPVANLTFNQVAFHTLFFADYYLGRDMHVTEQAFHREHPELFRDYEELLPRIQTHTYDRPTMRQYLRTTAGRRPSNRSPLKPPSHWASPSLHTPPNDAGRVPRLQHSPHSASRGSVVAAVEA